MAETVFQRWTTPEGRAGRVAWQKWLILGAMLALGGSLALPATKATEPDVPRALVGHFALIMSWPCSPSNVLLLLGPLAAWLLRQRRAPGTQRILMWLYTASAVWVAATPIVLRDSNAFQSAPAAGFYLWLGSHALMAIAMSLPVWGAAEARREAQRELRMLHDKWLRGADPYSAPAGSGADADEAVDPFVDGPSFRRDSAR